MSKAETRQELERLRDLARNQPLPARKFTFRRCDVFLDHLNRIGGKHGRKGH